MSHTSPATFLVWSILAAMLGSFLVYHLWKFDRFKCLKWNQGPYSGAFKRIMTYTYLLSIPCIMSFTLGFAIIKYREGFIFVPNFGVIPKPYQLWDPLSRRVIFPLTLLFSIGWSMEMVTHLEELCFWLFLVNARSAQQDWFHSLYFRAWTVGSSIAILYMPLVTIFTRSDPLKNEAYTFLAGSLGSTALTIWFTPILWIFPAFLRNLKSEGVDNATIVRLTKFHELNTIRVIFRFLFVLPLLILGVDGIRPHVHVNDDMLATDLLTMIAAIGCSVSSGITLVIFFPRSIEGEMSRKNVGKLLRSQGVLSTSAPGYSRSNPPSNYHPSELEYNAAQGSTGTYVLTSSPANQHADLPSHDRHENELYWSTTITPLSAGGKWEFGENPGHDAGFHEEAMLPAMPPMRPNRRNGNDVELGGFSSVGANLTEENLSVHNSKGTKRRSDVHPFVHNFTSPIDLAYGQRTPNNSRDVSRSTSRNASRLTFTRR